MRLQPKRAAILAYLAIARPGPWHRRDTLLALFWPESDEERGRGALSKAVYYLRDAAGPDLVLSHGDQELGLADADFWCDVPAFEDAMRRGAFQEAAAIYRGRLLEGFHLPGAPEFGHWLDTERDRLHRRALDAAWGLVDERESRGIYDEATEWARQALLWSPTDEIGLRRLLGLLHRQGMRPEAIRTYESFRTQCWDEYGIEPTDETKAQLEAIRDGSLPIPPSTPLAGGVSLSLEEAPHQGAPADPGSGRVPAPQSETQRPFALPKALFGRVALISVAAVLLIALSAIMFPGIRPAGEDTTQAARSRATRRVVLADFADGTEERLGRVVTEALRIDLLGASHLDLVEAADIAPHLQLMGVDARATLTAERARQVASRQGIPVVLDGEVTTVGGGYIIAATLRNAQTGRSLASFRVTAAGPDGVIGAIDRLSRLLREESGESLLSIRAAQPLEQATTGSLEALRLYTEAVAVFDLGNSQGSTRLLEQALARDSTFAMAWRLLGLASGEPQAIAKAFQFRDRLPDAERFVVEGLYYSSVERDGDAAMEAYRQALGVDPDEPRALNNLAGHHRGRGDLDGAVTLYRRAAHGAARSATAHGNLIGTLVFKGALEEAASELQAFDEAYPGHPAGSAVHFALSFAQGDLESAARQAGPRSADPGQLFDVRHAVNQGRLAYWAGRLDEARRLYLRAEALGTQPGWARRLNTVYEEDLVGADEWARMHFEEGAATERPPLTAAQYLTYAGDPAAAEILIQEWKDAAPEQLEQPHFRNDVERFSLQARVARGDTAGAIQTMQRLLLEAGCSDACWLFFRARLYDRLDARERASALYERVLLPGYAAGVNSGDVNVGERLYAMMRLGPLYEEIGDSPKAIAAYRRFVGQWATADARGMAVVRRFKERIAALGG